MTPREIKANSTSQATPFSRKNKNPAMPNPFSHSIFQGVVLQPIERFERIGLGKGYVVVERLAWTCKGSRSELRILPTYGRTSLSAGQI